MDKILLSKQKIEELKEDLKVLETSLLQKKEAEAARGGLLDSWHETAAQAATQGAIETKVKKMKDILQRAKLLPEKIGGNKVVLGSRVELHDQKKKIFKYRLVHPIESDPFNGLISIQSPIGNKLLGKKIGDTLEIQEKKFKITRVS